jgi:hypothetical protein
VAALTAAAAIAAAVISAVAARGRLDRELQHQRQALRDDLTGEAQRQTERLRHERTLAAIEDARLALDHAAALAIEYRERIATALREIESEQQLRGPRAVEVNAPLVEGSVVPLRELSRDERMAFRQAEARLILRFGVDHPVRIAFREYWEALRASVRTRSAADGPVADRPTMSDIAGQRDATRIALNTFLDAATAAFHDWVDATRAIESRDP